MGFRDWLAKILRFRDQETVELAEKGLAPEDDVRATEARIAEHRHERDEQPPQDD
jgi:hypothetical protein